MNICNSNFQQCTTSFYGRLDKELVTHSGNEQLIKSLSFCITNQTIGKYSSINLVLVVEFAAKVKLYLKKGVKTF